ncbi:hypothetical protein BGZ91_004249 [Linnemannia elongata]|nr:hypothetical protein BGZ91_004249 [Linnemannia elongata]KAG0076832.1 hypothetical protein BGZ90_008124 [Linnemannia elongata]
MTEERPTTAEPHHESELDEHTLLLHLQQTIANNTAALQQQQDNNNHNTDAQVSISSSTAETTASTEDNASTTHNQPAATGASTLETIPVTSQDAAVAAVAAFANSFNDTTADDIKALTKALTTPIEQIEAEERAAAAAVAAVAASVAASTAGVDHSIIAKTDITTPAFDVNNVYNQVLSSIASQTQTATTEGKRTAQEAFEQTQAAQALQLIALSLGSVTSTTTTTLESAETTGHADDTAAHLTGDGAGAVPGTTDPLLSITEAINNFQRQTEQHPELDEDTTAIAQAVLLATQANANKETLQGTPQAGPSSSSAESGANQGLTFEVDKATGKTQIKWVPDSRDDASVIQQALHTLIANSGILGVPNGGLLAPPLGQFPAQGSQFGTAKEPVKTEPAVMAPPPAPHVHKRRRTGGSSTQNTAASIPEGATAYPCTFDGCDKVFARLYNLKSHSRTHTNERPFICSHCQLPFARNHDLKRHVKIHGGDKPFKCGGCGKSFSRLDALGRHKYNSKNRANCVDSITPVLE